MRTVLIANRGEIACRIIATLKRMGLRAVAVYSDADRHAAHVSMADAAVRLGPAPAAESYLNVEAILAACREHSVDAVHPGYGFLSENVAFAEALAQQGIAFIGPSPEHIRLFGQKHTAREAAAAAGLPLLPGTGLLNSVPEAVSEAERIGYPLMLKSTAGGGGIGLQLCFSAEELPALFERVRRASEANFGDGRLYLERYVARARHVEVQIFGSGGRVLALGERDCSLQRRHQKVIEETPAPNLPDHTRAALRAAATALGTAVGYRSAGTVEFIYDADSDAFYFLEVNTRLQVEHPVTEAVTGIDLVEWMVAEARGDFTLPPTAPSEHGHAIEARIYAEDPGRDFRPSSGRITAVTFPDGPRIDGWISAGVDVPPHYDPLLAKLIVHGPTREAAVKALAAALAATDIAGIATNTDYLGAIAASPDFVSGNVSTSALGAFDYRPRTVEVTAPGMQSTLQDWPGRLGAWHVGVPPSGPMDALSHRLANSLVGNASDALALECTLLGPTLVFHAATRIALTGADMGATLDSTPVEQFRVIDVPAGATLALGNCTLGLRAYLAVAGGFQAPEFLGSAATFTLGGFGGHGVGALRAGDLLRIHPTPAEHPDLCTDALVSERIPQLTHDWSLGVLYGPHGAPDFFTNADIETFQSAVYRVGANSARTGVRLEGPKPQFARPDGGEAGLHPSNIHDNAYAVGAIDLTGDMPIILGPDGPSLGGFVCPFVVCDADLWKVGQLRPGDRVRFVPLPLAEARKAHRAVETALAEKTALPAPAVKRMAAELESPIRLVRTDGDVPVHYRRTGENYLLVEFGDNTLDLNLRVRAHLLHQQIEAEGLPAIIDLTPGIRSLQVHFDATRLAEQKLIDALDAIERDLPPSADAVIPSRTVHLPLAWDDSQTQRATERYQGNVRPDAPWCPSNIEFIRRINGLTSVDEVKSIVFDAQYLVYGLGDVYLGAPVATPIDPRHRLVTTKYNPARTWTPENAVGIGGAYLCIYGMEGPGGYQFVGRTVQIWNTYRQTPSFRDGVPWLLRYFDRLHFYPVSEAELLEMREGFPHGAVNVQIDEGTLDIGAVNHAHADNRAAIDQFRTQREHAFAQERQRWEDAGLSVPTDLEISIISVKPQGAVTVDASLSGVVWDLRVEPGQTVTRGDVVAVLEAMKMEVPVHANASGRVGDVLVAPRQLVNAGDALFTLLPG